jgi:NAD(P)-dependent dehydrogenase (short-subunit alcohol dehydrogenase family)
VRAAPIAIITGATSGIGRAAALQLIERGVQVVCVGRDARRGEETVRELSRLRADLPARFFQADLSSIAATKALGVVLREACPRIDILINNAGTLFDKKRISVDGLEMTFALNHLAYFVLTHELLASLRQSSHARIVSVSSGAHHGASLDLGDLNYEHEPYGGTRAYRRSKLANVLFTRALAKRLPATMTANCLHPGFVASRFGNENGLLWRAVFRSLQVFGISSEQSARALVHLALAAELQGVTGQYFNREKLATPSAAARDDALAEALWTRSAELTGLSEVWSV